jgi:hypothetical protein
VGLAEYYPGQTQTQLLEAADIDLYQKKQEKHVYGLQEINPSSNTNLLQEIYHDSSPDLHR